AVAQALGAPVDRNYCAFGLRYKSFESDEAGTPFIGVQAVAPGGWLRIRAVGNGVKVQRGYWYDLKSSVALRSNAIREDTDEELLQECLQLLRDAIHIRMRSDVPLAVSLSGGLDSSTVAAIAAGM